MNEYYNMTPAELEAEAYRTENKLALEIIRRMETEFIEMINKGQVVINYTDGTTGTR